MDDADETMPGTLEAPGLGSDRLAGIVGTTGAGADAAGRAEEPEEAPGLDDGLAAAGPTAEVPIAGRVLVGLRAALLDVADEPASLVP